MNKRAARRTAVALLNPTAGHGRGRAAAEPTLRALHEHGLDVVEITAETRADAEAACTRALATHSPDVLVSVGGDGTHSVAIGAAAAHRVPLALVPAGTGNDLARALGLLCRDVAAAVDIAVTGVARTLDLARVRTETTERLYATVLTSGFDSRVADRTNAMAWPTGQARYLLAIAAEYARLRVQPFRVLIDGAVVHDGPAILAAVGNTDSYGGGMRMCAGADPTDGLLDVTVIADVAHPRLELPRVLPRVLRGTHLSHPAVHTFRGRTVELESPATTAYADGDSVGSLPVRVEAAPGALEVLTPPG